MKKGSSKTLFVVYGAILPTDRRDHCCKLTMLVIVASCNNVRCSGQPNDNAAVWNKYVSHNDYLRHLFAYETNRLAEATDSHLSATRHLCRSQVSITATIPSTNLLPDINTQQHIMAYSGHDSLSDDSVCSRQNSHDTYLDHGSTSEDSSSNDSHYGHQNYHCVHVHHPVPRHRSLRSHGHPRSNPHEVYQPKPCRGRQSVHNRARSPSPILSRTPSPLGPPIYSRTRTLIRSRMLSRTPSPPPAAKPRRCKHRKARSPSPPARRYGTREASHDPTGYTSIAASLANLKLDTHDSDTDDTGVLARLGRARTRAATTRAEYEAYSRLRAHGGRARLPRPAARAYNPRARSPSPTIRRRRDSRYRPSPSTTNC